MLSFFEQIEEIDKQKEFINYITILSNKDDNRDKIIPLVQKIKQLQNQLKSIDSKIYDIDACKNIKSLIEKTNYSIQITLNEILYNVIKKI